MTRSERKVTPASSPPGNFPAQSASASIALAQASWISEDAVDALLHGRHSDPFSVLGIHRQNERSELRVFVPGAQSVAVRTADGGISPLYLLRDGLFVGAFAAEAPNYVLMIDWSGIIQETEDPYAFGPILGDIDLHLMAEGHHGELAGRLGAHTDRIEDVDGVRFAVWAPNAQRVSVIGDFNGWDGRRHPMRLRHYAGVWEIFIPRLGAGARYKYEIVAADGATLLKKADPFARQSEAPPATASIVVDSRPFTWNDAHWMEHRVEAHAATAPLSFYEVHLESWLRESAEGECAWDHLGTKLLEYVKAMGFTHIELMPIMEHPFGGSWGYQPLGMFAPTARYGSPQAFARFVDRCHGAGVGVVLDWVPAHFPSDPYGLAQFDGTALYEYGDPREGFHPDWNTMIYNLGRNEVRNFMIASGLYWLNHFHVDGLRVDAVASMLYRDYSRRAGEWVPNKFGGRENLEAVDFLRELNAKVAEQCPGAMTIAEESTSWPGVTAKVADGGLGFNYKWNMGWMHDTLKYMEYDAIYRRFHHNELTFGMVYAYSERFVLPLSHDEVVHGKGSLLTKMPGDRWQKFANLRSYYGFMWTHPGKKLLFMGSELAQTREWNHDGEVDWAAAEDGMHKGVQTLVRDLNHLYRELSALHRTDADPAGFAWLVGDDAGNSVTAFVRKDGDRHVLSVSNLTPVVRNGYRIGVPRAGHWAERLNTDAAVYGGSDLGNSGGANTEDHPAHGHGQSLALTLPALATLIFEFRG